MDEKHKTMQTHRALDLRHRIAIPEINLTAESDAIVMQRNDAAGRLFCWSGPRIMLLREAQKPDRHRPTEIDTSPEYVPDQGTQMSVESAVTIVSGIVTILTGLFALVRYIYRTLTTFPQDPEPIPQTSSRSSRPSVPQIQSAGSSDLVEAEYDSPGVNAGRSFWKSARDSLADLAPISMAFFGFSIWIIYAVLIRATNDPFIARTGEFWFFIIFLITLFFCSWIFYAIGCIISVLLYGATGRALRQTTMAILVLCTITMLFGWLANGFPGCMIGMVVGLALGLTPVVFKGASRFASRTRAQSYIRTTTYLCYLSKIGDKYGTWAQMPNAWPVVREIALLVGIDHGTVEYEKETWGNLRNEIDARIDRVATTMANKKKAQRHLDED